MKTEAFKEHDEVADIRKINEIQVELMRRQGIAHQDAAEIKWIESYSGKFRKLITENAELLQYYDSSDSFKKEQILSKIEEILEKK